MKDAGVQPATGMTADALRGTFPGCEDASLALTLVRLLAEGEPVTTAALVAKTERPAESVKAQLAGWPNVEHDEHGSVVSQFTIPVDAYTSPVRELFLNVEPAAQGPQPVGETVMTST